MAISMVNVGLMTLQQSIGILLGADIGTTITAWIVALHVTEHGLIILGVSGLLYLFSRNERVKFTSMFLLGIGMIFFGLSLMKHGMNPLRECEDFITWFSRFNPDTYAGLFKCVLVGSITTAIMQSSSATIAITILLANGGVIGFNTAVALVLGQNIGTTITAFLASLGASTPAKRTAYAHILIKIIGVAVVFPFFYLYMRFLAFLMPEAMVNDLGKQIALAHTLFNLIIVMLFLPLTAMLSKMLMRFIPSKVSKEIPHLAYLDVGLAETPVIALQESSNAILKMRDGVDKMMMWFGDELENPHQDSQRRKKLLHREEILDVIQKEIVEFISRILQKNLPLEIITEGRRQLRIADEYESISDYLTSLLKLNDRLVAQNSNFAKNDILNVKMLHAKVAQYLTMIGEALASSNTDIMTKATSYGTQITELAKQFRDEHLLRVEEPDTSPQVTLIIIDMLQSYRKIRAHAMNIAEAVAGLK
jgi:phosphate:Na+ symporter